MDPRLFELLTPRVRNVPAPMYGPANPEGDFVSFSFGFAAPTLFPTQAMQAASAQVLAHEAAESLNYAPSYAGLTDLVVQRMQAQGIPATPDRVLITHGSSEMLALLPELFVNPGDPVLIEGPTFLGAVRHFQDAGAQIVTMPLDEQGIIIEALEDILRDLAAQGKRPKFIYTIPTFQNPTGTTLPLERRKRLLALAEEYGTFIVEDDAYYDLRFEGEPVPTLAAMDTKGLVLRLGTFSKILAPGVRLGWVYAQPELIQRIQFVRSAGNCGPFITRVVSHFCAEGRLEAHIKVLNDHYRKQRDVMLDAIARELPAEFKPLRPEGGFFVWCTLPDGLSVSKFAKTCAEHGALIMPGVRCFADGQGDNAMRLAFSFLSADEINIGISRIAEALRHS
jgi:2-aminoadipate transaminase